MVKTRFELNKGLLHFNCPECNGEDAVYMDVPTGCWRCQTPYVFELAKLILNKEERAYYHFNGFTFNKKKALCHNID